MQEGQLLMTQADRDRLVTLKKAKKKLITQREAAGELGISTRQVKRLLYALKKRGDKAVVHGLRGRPSQRRIGESFRADVSGRVFAQKARDRGQQRDGAEVDDPGQAVAGEEREGERRPYL